MYREKHIYRILKGRFDNSPVERFKTMSHDEKRKYKMVLGHMPFGLHEYIEGPSNYIGFLRDPVKRVISLYHYFKRRPETVIHERVQTISLESFSESNLIADLDNGQVRYLCGIEELGVGELTASITESHLDLAKSNLENHFAAISITERFNESLILLNRNLGWDVLHYRQANVNPNKDKVKVSDEAIQLIAERNKFDIALYEYAIQLFEKQIEACGPEFKDQLAAFEKKNAQLNRFVPFYFSMDKAVNIKLNRGIRKLKNQFGQ